MSRKGRAFEELIKELEELGTVGLQITSPDFIKDNITGQFREVDISIRGLIGSHNILIVIECRDRKSKQGIEWIEQISEKTKDIGANKVIAVSSSGFTKNAIVKAKVKNIQLNAFEEVNPEKVMDLFEIIEGTHTYYGYNLKQVFLILDSDCDNAKKLLKENPDILKNNESIKPYNFIERKSIFCKNDKKTYSMAKILASQFSHQSKKIYDGIEPNGERKLKWFNLKFCKEDGFQYSVKNLRIDLVSFKVQAELWIETELMPYKGFSIYQTQKEILAQIHKFEIPQLGCDFRLVHKLTPK
jgi:hypothetical protein